MSTFSPEQEDAIRALQALWGPDRIVLIGGAALAEWIGMSWRTTLDIDLLVGLDPEAASTGLSTLPGWRKDPRHEPRWVAPGHVMVDVLPVTPEILRAGQIRWPRSGGIMSTAGLELVGPKAVTVPLGGGASLRVAPLTVLALLKMASFLDRPHDRARDLADIAWIMHTYASPCVPT